MASNPSKYKNTQNRDDQAQLCNIDKQIPHFKICKVVPQVGNSLLERHSPHTTIPRYAAGMLGILTVLNKALIKTSLLSS